MHLKATSSFSPLKPTPLQDADLRHCAGEAQCGAVTVLYGRIIACLKHLHGTRNPAIAEWRWGDIHFVRTDFWNEEAKRNEVRPTCAGPI